LRVILASALALGALASACGSSSDATRAKAAVRVAASTTFSASPQGESPAQAPPAPAHDPEFPGYIAAAVQPEVDVHSSPGGLTTLTLSNPTSEGVPLTFLLTPGITQTGSSWVQVHLPVKPNGSTGWIPASELSVQGDPYRLVVNQSAHQLSMYNYDALEHTYPVAVGAPATPTPVGTFYLTELLKTTNPGVYGDYAYGLSGHSPTLTDFDGYDAEIGLHGTGDPSSIGHSVSHGCVRLNNADIDALVSVGLPLGTPVEIQP
jgi:lipoprotein-anchoring transpeptidase ErfK/SrfK